MGGAHDWTPSVGLAHDKPIEIRGRSRPSGVPLRTPNYVTNSHKETSMSSSPPRDWTKIRWSEVPPAELPRWIGGLPRAATEQHGPHLPLETDVLIAEAYLARVRELLPENNPATFLPVERIG